MHHLFALQPRDNNKKTFNSYSAHTHTYTYFIKYSPLSTCAFSLPTRIFVICWPSKQNEKKNIINAIMSREITPHGVDILHFHPFLYIHKHISIVHIYETHTDFQPALYICHVLFWRQLPH